MKHETDYTTPRTVVKALAPGLYTLKQMYADQWLDVRRKRACGRWFRLAVGDFQVADVRLVGRRSNRSLEYEVRAEVTQTTEVPPPSVTRVTAHQTSPVLSKATEQ